MAQHVEIVCNIADWALLYVISIFRNFMERGWGGCYMIKSKSLAVGVLKWISSLRKPVIFCMGRVMFGLSSLNLMNTLHESSVK